MSSGTEKKIFYFDKKGAENTDKTIDIALTACEEREMTSSSMFLLNGTGLPSESSELKSCMTPIISSL